MSNAPREDVIKLAREAGFAVGIGSPALPKFTHLIQLVKAEEREACAKVCDVSIADALEFRREQYGLKAREFAAILGMTPSHYSEVVSKGRNLPLNARIRAFAIGVPAEVLLQPGSEMERTSKQTGATHDN